MKTFTNIDQFKAYAKSVGSIVKIVSSHEEEPFIEYIASIDGKTCGFFADADNFDGDETGNFGHHDEIETERDNIRNQKQLDERNRQAMIESCFRRGIDYSHLLRKSA